MAPIAVIVIFVGALILIFSEKVQRTIVATLGAALMVGMGYASAFGWILALLILSITLLILRSAPMWVHYEAERE